MLLQLDNIQKRFGGVTALRAANLAVEAGEVHLLMGENGAGKSTLAKIVAGMLAPDGGEMRFRDAPVRFRNPAEAAAGGIAMVHQESLLAPHLSVAENIFLGREERLPLGWVPRREIVERARRLIAQHRFPLQAEWRVGKLSPAGKQMVEICRAIEQGSSLLIFDEPTSSLTASETQEVFRIVRELRARQVGVIYITHRLEELRAVGDRVTVLRDGETVHSGTLAELSMERLIQHMVGREVTTLYRREPATPGDEMLRVTGLTRAPLLEGISFSLRAGEIVGLAGLIGAGRTELCRALFGIDRPDAGEVRIGGKVTRIRNPRDAVRAGLALIPEDRQRTGLATGLPVAYNMTMASLGRVSHLGFLSLGSERSLTSDQARRLRLRYDGPAQLARRLSGGNQQKVVIAKWLACGARVFLFDEPTKGIDVGAKVEVFETMDELARGGAAILMVSSELAELQSVADRILVMRQGRLAGELPHGASQEEILRLAAFQEAS
ncbi:MAG: D-xylose ABC transporter ATP-binding protein [Acidobacteria bacterium]|nr:MAG: D-xylose ABC transporter ATP-binding protein [Acidobacteriota bacterium]